MYSFLILLTKGTPQGVVKKFRTTMSGVEAWRALIEKYEQKGEVRVSALHNQLINSSMDGGEDPEAFFLRIEDLRQRLKDIEVDISDATLKAIATSKLPSVYEPLRAVLDTMKNLTYDDLKDHVKAFYERKIASGDITDHPERAFHANSTKRFNGTCYNCGMTGHKSLHVSPPQEVLQLWQELVILLDTALTRRRSLLVLPMRRRTR